MGLSTGIRPGNLAISDLRRPHPAIVMWLKCHGDCMHHSTPNASEVIQFKSICGKAKGGYVPDPGCRFNASRDRDLKTTYGSMMETENKAEVSKLRFYSQYVGYAICFNPPIYY